MNAEELKPNSHKYKERASKSLPEKNIEKVTTGTVRTKKKSDLRKLADVFIPEDVESVKSYILMDVLVPTIKKTVVDIVSDGIQILMYGEKRGNNNSRSIADKVSYRNYYDDKRDDRRSRRPQPRQIGTYIYDDIILDSRGEAEDVLRHMGDLIETFNMVSVADYCELAGAKCEWTDNKYGWFDIRSAHVIRTRDGYMIKLPKAVPLDD